jgi:hypothetical protein
MSEAAYPRLWQLFGAFFHQDWDCSYLPRPDLGGPTVRAWLGQFAGFRRAGARQAEPNAGRESR